MSRNLGGSVAHRDLHFEIVGAIVIVVIVVEPKLADVLLADEDIGRIRFARHDANARVAEQPLEVGVELPDFLHVHGTVSLQSK